MTKSKTGRAKTEAELADFRKQEDHRKLMTTTTVKIDLAELLKLRFQRKLGKSDIARHFGCSPAAVTNRLKPFEEMMNLGKVEDSDLASMFKGAAVAHLTEAVKPSKAKALKADRNMLAAAMALDKSRLLSGQSTDNIGVMVRLVREACEAAPLPAPPVTEMVTEGEVVETEPSDT